MTVFEQITSKHFETTLSQNNAVSNAIKRDIWIAINYTCNYELICYDREIETSVRPVTVPTQNMPIRAFEI